MLGRGKTPIVVPPNFLALGVRLLTQIASTTVTVP